MQHAPSERLIDQRIRNQIVAEVEAIARRGGDDHAFTSATDFSGFCFWLGEGHDPAPNSTMTTDEVDGMRRLCRAIEAASVEPHPPGWCHAIHDEAERLLLLFDARGRFCEDCAEDEPSTASGAVTA